MPQMHLYVREELADRVKRRANEEGKSVSQVLADVVEREFKREWPSDFRERFLGKWEGPPIEIEALPQQERDFGLEEADWVYPRQSRGDDSSEQHVKSR